MFLLGSSRYENYCKNSFQCKVNFKIFTHIFNVSRSTDYYGVIRRPWEISIIFSRVWHCFSRLFITEDKIYFKKSPFSRFAIFQNRRKSERLEYSFVPHVNAWCCTKYSWNLTYQNHACPTWTQKFFLLLAYWLTGLLWIPGHYQRH